MQPYVTWNRGGRERDPELGSWTASIPAATRQPRWRVVRDDFYASVTVVKAGKPRALHRLREPGGGYSRSTRLASTRSLSLAYDDSAMAVPSRRRSSSLSIDRHASGFRRQEGHLSRRQHQALVQGRRFAVHHRRADQAGHSLKDYYEGPEATASRVFRHRRKRGVPLSGMTAGAWSSTVVLTSTRLARP